MHYQINVLSQLGFLLLFSSLIEQDLVSSAQEVLPTTLTTTASSTSTTSKGSFFDTFDLESSIKDSDVNSTSFSKNDDAPSLTALEQSFGGTTKKPDTNIPTRRKTGLYFLVDWNSFLEVGEDGKDKVNLRFQPKVGDRSRFVKVTVP